MSARSVATTLANWSIYPPLDTPLPRDQSRKRTAVLREGVGKFRVRSNRTTRFLEVTPGELRAEATEPLADSLRVLAVPKVLASRDARRYSPVG